jgi:hypothetical protein
LSHVGLAGRLHITVGRAGQTEIENLGLAALLYQNVSRFQIAVDDATLMGMLNRFANLDHQGKPLASVQMLRFCVFDERLAVDNLHGKEGLGAEPGFGGAGLIDLSDARMVETAESLRLQLEPAQQFAVGPCGLDDLERDLAAGLVLLSLVDRTHSALAEQANNAVVADGGRHPGCGNCGGLRPRRREGCVGI